jgi:hypothetical protein
METCSLHSQTIRSIFSKYSDQIIALFLSLMLSLYQNLKLTNKILIMTPITSLSEKEQAWVYFTYAHAKEHGWEPFHAYQIVKKHTTEFHKKSASFLHHGHWVYEGSVSELQPGGVTMSLEDAISLSFQRWSPSLQVGTRPDLYVDFEADYVKKQNLLRRLRSRL